MQTGFAGLLSAISICTMVNALPQDFSWNLQQRLVPQYGNNTHYVLQDLYEGESFFTDWSFYNQADPTHGNVNYLSMQNAQAQHLAYVENNVTVLAVDSKSQVAVGGLRNSVRITSNKVYNGGLFILDAVAIPMGCGVWPSFWSFGPQWPNNGEIDVVEGVNGLTYNQMTLHTGTQYTCEVGMNNSLGSVNGTAPEIATSLPPVNKKMLPRDSLPPGGSLPTPTPSNWPPISTVPPCTSTLPPPPQGTPLPAYNSTNSTTPGRVNLTNPDPTFTGHVLNANCNTAATANEGCGIVDSNPDSFGPGFNRIGGGVFALLWDKTNGIRIWHFNRGQIPKDITTRKPDPAGWGTPAAAWGSSTCDITSNFQNHQLVFDTTICGDWAGAAGAYSSSGCPGTCSQIVANATNFAAAQWKINSVAVYQ